MKKPKRKKAKPVLAWGIKWRGSLLRDVLFEDYETGWDYIENIHDGGRAVPVEIREVKK